MNIDLDGLEMLLKQIIITPTLDMRLHLTSSLRDESSKSPCLESRGGDFWESFFLSDKELSTLLICNDDASVGTPQHCYKVSWNEGEALSREQGLRQSRYAKSACTHSTRAAAVMLLSSRPNRRKVAWPNEAQAEDQVEDVQEILRSLRQILKRQNAMLSDMGETLAVVF